MLVVRTPLAESLNVENVVAYYIHVNVDRSNIILILKTNAYELTLVGTLVLDTINKVRATLNHSLVNQFLERLFLAAYAKVEEELIPEA